MTKTIALLGAAGAMGTRASRALALHPEAFTVLPVEATGEGEAKLRERGLTPIPQQEAVGQADATILAAGERVHVRFDHGAEPVGQRAWRGLRLILLRQLGV